MLSLLPAIGSIFSVVFIALYPLSEAKIAAIANDLEQRRSAHHKTTHNNVESAAIEASTL
jgi:GPH family glycoside/pentoside/hexuronide:cation symporter